MKELINKIIKNSIAVMISCIVVYGAVYAQQIPCNAGLDACITRSNSISVSFKIDNYSRTSPAHHFNDQAVSNICFKDYLTDLGSGNTCCETDRCDSYSQTNYFRPSFNQESYLVQNDVRSIAAGNGTQTAFRPYRLSTSFKAVPIYIATQSIIC